MFNITVNELMYQVDMISVPKNKELQELVTAWSEITNEYGLLKHKQTGNDEWIIQKSEEKTIFV